MKRGKMTICRFLALVVAVFAAAFFVGCGVNTETLSEVKVAEIERLYCEQYPETEDPISEMNYLGNYNGYDAILVKFSFIDGICDAVITVGGVEVGIFPPTTRIDVYDQAEGTIESIYTAYESGKIGKGDLRTIRTVCKEKGYSKKVASLV